MSAKIYIEIMRSELKTLAKMKPELKIINCENPILNIDIKGHSDKPDLVVLNGTVTEGDFESAKSLIPSGGVIAFTRGNGQGEAKLKENTEEFGDLYKIVSKGGYFVLVDTLLIYVKGVEPEDKEPDFKEYIKRDIDKLLMHNFKARYNGLEFKEIEEEKPKKRKRRTKAEIEADKAKEESK